jgi:hypothetical protein
LDLTWLFDLTMRTPSDRQLFSKAPRCRPTGWNVVYLSRFAERPLVED